MNLHVGWVAWIAAAALVVPGRSGAADEPVVLRVAMYPYVPAAHDLFFKLEQAFEASNPGVDVQLVETYQLEGEPQQLKDGYYTGGLALIDADVYEVDTILLADLVEKFQLVALPTDRTFAPLGLTASQVGGKIYGVPHWMCGNFLFYRKSDTAIRDAKTWDDLTKVVGENPAEGGVLVDLRGSLTMGEWYLTALSETVDSNALFGAVTSASDSKVIATVQRVLNMCPTGFCRSNDFHNRDGFYSRMFVRGLGRAYIGYSESLHDALTEYANVCTASSGCVSPDDIAIRRLPQAPGRSAIGWVDVLAVDKRLTSRKLGLAHKWIDYVTSSDAYRAVLNGKEAPPRYLLPAVQLSKEIEGAPRYPDFFREFGDRVTLSGAGIGAKLAPRSCTLNCALPFDRTDEKGPKKCPPIAQCN